MIYLDHNATTPLDERVLDAMLPYLRGFYGNPSALYRLGRLSRTALDTARLEVAELEEQVIRFAPHRRGVADGRARLDEVGLRTKGWGDNPSGGKQRLSGIG